jgi:Fe-S cluster assembly protein SufD
MNVVVRNDYLAGLLAGQPAQPASPSDWLSRLRAEALERVGVLTVPTTRDEEWRFTDISPLTQVPFLQARAGARLDAAAIERFALPEAETRLVFVDGVHAPHLSVNTSGIVVEPLAAGVVAHAAAVEPYLGRLAAFRDNVFAAVNTAFLQDGALVLVPRDRQVAAPIHLLHVATQQDVAAYPRCLVVAEAGSAVTLVEDFVALQDEAYFTNAVTEIAVGDGAQVRHVRVQRESGKAFHIANCAVSVARDSHYQSVSVTLGARISRYNLDVLQTSEGAHCAIDGLALIGARQLADTHSFIDHAKPHGVSRQLHKCIVGGAAHAVFNGKIMVRAGAQLTDSVQSSRNLLLSDKAHVDTKPQLEIFADDVKCAHGATVGQLDSEEVFYLQSRGLSDAAARNLLTFAFGAEVIARIPVRSLAKRLEQTVLEQTQNG